jgi:hypothetical protein
MLFKTTFCQKRLQFARSHLLYNIGVTLEAL